MTHPLRSVPYEGDVGLSIGELAERTGVKATTLRAWEERYGFPVPDRRASGHRRYSEASAEHVLEVMALRDSGTRVGAAISQVLDRERARDVPRSSVFADVRAAHPELQPQRLRKSTLLALSWAVEDEVLARAGRAHLFGSFQRERFYRSAEARWDELGRSAVASFVFADFPDVSEPAVRSSSPNGPVLVPLPADSPMLREWTVVCDMADLPCAMVAWELPGHESPADRDPVFEAIWTLDHSAVRTAALSSAGNARAYGAPGAEAAEASLARTAGAGVTDLRAASALMNRVLAYVDTPPH